MSEHAISITDDITFHVNTIERFGEQTSIMVAVEGPKPEGISCSKYFPFYFHLPVDCAKAIADAIYDCVAQVEKEQ